MASIYHRKDSAFIWISYKDINGKWKSANTGFRKGIKEDEKEAQRHVRAKTLEEKSQKPFRARANWDWTAEWLTIRYGHNASGRTLELYMGYLRHWLTYFQERGITGPANAKRENVLSYFKYRQETGRVGHNQVIMEIKFLAMIMDEARKRGLTGPENPARGLQLKTGPRKEKVVWSLDELDLVERTLGTNDRFGWMHVTFLMGRYQAVRLRQSQVPLSCISFARRMIDYPGKIVKGGKGYDQPIDPEFIDELKLLVQHRQLLGKSMLCEVPKNGSVDWYHFLVSLGLKHLCHHGLRATWITEAAKNKVPEAFAMKFVNHASQEVHRIYQKLTSIDLLPILDDLAEKRQAARAARLALAATPSDDPQLLDEHPTRTDTLPASTSPTFDGSPA